MNGDGVSDTGARNHDRRGRRRALPARRARHRHRNMAFLVGAAESLASFDAERAGLRRALLGGGLAALALATAGGLWIARGALRPLARMALDARSITEHTPGARLQAPATRDELGVLGDAFNELLGRLEGALAQQRRFMADASHELRTPVSVARTAIEVGLARSGPARGGVPRQPGASSRGRSKGSAGSSRTCSRWPARTRARCRSSPRRSTSTSSSWHPWKRRGSSRLRRASRFVRPAGRRRGAVGRRAPPAPDAREPARQCHPPHPEAGAASTSSSRCGRAPSRLP